MRDTDLTIDGPISRAQRTIAADHAHADPAIWITRRPDADILADARALEAEGPRGRPLWGLPFAVKDNIDVAGIPTTAACPGFAYTPEQDAPVARRLRDAGALLIGKTNLDQFATGLVGVRSPYGVPRNVFDPLRVPGGSSSGSGCVVGAGIVPLALGTDTAGSGRVPAMFNNIVGLKPTIGSLSARGMVPACRSIDTISIFARSVDDALAALRVCAGVDDADPYSRAPPFPYLRRGAVPTVARVAIPTDPPPCAPAVTEAFAAAAAMFAAKPVDITPFLEIARLLYEGPWVAERTSALRDFLTTNPGAIHPVTKKILDSGFARDSVAAFDAFHRLAETRRAAARLFRAFDALLVPTAPFCPTLAELEADPIGPNSRLGTFTNFVNLCDLAAIAVPTGIGADGLPTSVTLIGPAWSEGRLAAIADHLHRRLATTTGAGREMLPLPVPPDPLQPDETALFCVGAHMAGLPLNHQITAVGGRFLRGSRTKPIYRLYALGKRPGLVRAPAEMAAASISGETWAVPTESIGALLAQVPPPLGFGTVLLEDGPCLGFLAESAGLAGGTEITRFGGWRAWLDAGSPETVPDPI